jgi:hypothetical protein
MCSFRPADSQQIRFSSFKWILCKNCSVEYYVCCFYRATNEVSHRSSFLGFWTEPPGAAKTVDVFVDRINTEFYAAVNKETPKESQCLETHAPKFPYLHAHIGPEGMLRVYYENKRKNLPIPLSCPWPHLVSGHKLGFWPARIQEQYYSWHICMCKP